MYLAYQCAFSEEDSNLIPLFLFLIFYAGVFTGAIIRMISDIRAKHGEVNLEKCGKFTLAEDLSDISDMTSIDLSSIDSLEGRCCLEECSFPRIADQSAFPVEYSILWSD